MIDREIIEKIATDFMGWQYLPITERKPRRVTVWFWRLDGTMRVRGSVNCQNFDPLNDPAAVALVLDEIERLGFRWEWGYYDWGDHLDYMFRLWNEDGAEGEGISDARYRAVCLAVLAAVDKGWWEVGE
jgi:hypothetical protein